MNDLFAGIGNEQWQHHKDAYGHDHGKHHNSSHKNLLHLFPENLVQPEFEFSRLRIFIILKEAGGKA